MFPLNDKVAVVPETVVVAIGNPLANNVKLVMSEGSPAPDTDKVKLVILMTVVLGFANWTC